MPQKQGRFFKESKSKVVTADEKLPKKTKSEDQTFIKNIDYLATQLIPEPDDKIFPDLDNDETAQKQASTIIQILKNIIKENTIEALIKALKDKLKGFDINTYHLKDLEITLPHLLIKYSKDEKFIINVFEPMLKNKHLDLDAKYRTNDLLEASLLHHKMELACFLVENEADPDVTISIEIDENGDAEKVKNVLSILGKHASKGDSTHFTGLFLRYLGDAMMKQSIKEVDKKIHALSQDDHEGNFQPTIK